ncbi:uncharacterized protein F4822DRAFT_427943 [Hypoxylon trugodes]|uniref:uncharacterized protein n=1 Tax=Hypoxylon trugodes TaxID=326681 RepID=UPI00218ED1BD|nr:uncharacterized protein F4822DRAFT_427943 [Hypoxylon trugodes]KAI1389598.1 hypothetical protein F4822DRAFT_427943 [Hypoxylon trugodes]
MADYHRLIESSLDIQKQLLKKFEVEHMKTNKSLEDFRSVCIQKNRKEIKNASRIERLERSQHIRDLAFVAIVVAIFIAYIIWLFYVYSKYMVHLVRRKENATGYLRGWGLNDTF